MKNSKIIELSERTIALLENTKKQYNLYENERHQLYNYLVKKDDLIEWEKYIKK